MDEHIKPKKKTHAQPHPRTQGAGPHDAQLPAQLYVLGEAEILFYACCMLQKIREDCNKPLL